MCAENGVLPVQTVVLFNGEEIKEWNFLQWCLPHNVRSRHAPQHLPNALPGSLQNVVI